MRSLQILTCQQASPQSSGLPGHLPRAPVSRIPHEAAALLPGPPQPGWSGWLQANELCAPPGRGPVTWPGIRSERHGLLCTDQFPRGPVACLVACHPGFICSDNYGLTWKPSSLPGLSGGHPEMKGQQSRWASQLLPGRTAGAALSQASRFATGCPNAATLRAFLCPVPCHSNP